MKNLKSFVSYLLIIAMCIAASPAFAAGTSANVTYNPANGIVFVSGEAQGNTSIRTVPFDFVLSSASTSNLYTDFDHIYTTGGYSYDFIMPDSAAYGKYVVYVNDGEVSSDSFMYYNTSDADLLIPMLNTKTTGTALEIAIDSNADALGIDKDDSFYIANSSTAADILAPNLMPFTDSTDFYIDYQGALAMSAMNTSSRNTVENLLRTYESNLGISYSSYSVLSDRHKADICNLLSTMNFKTEFSKLKQLGETVSFANLLKRTTALSAVRIASNRLEMKDAFLLDYNDVLGSIVTSNTDYNSSMETAVFTRLKNVGVFTSFETLKQSFNDAVSYVKAQNAGSKPVVTSPGPSSVTMPSSNVTPGNEYDAETPVAGTEVKTTMAAPVLSSSLASYTDVYEASWEHTAVATLGGNGIISGYTDGSFRPSNMITRAEFAKLISAAFSVNAKKIEFSDVSPDDWHYPYVSVLAGAGIINGYEGKFSPNANITREDAAVIIYRLSSKLGKNYYGSVNFGDLNDVSVYALTAVRSLGNAGIINGDNNLNFNPRANLTRAEAAQLLYNFIGALAAE